MKITVLILVLQKLISVESSERQDLDEMVTGIEIDQNLQNYRTRKSSSHLRIHYHYTDSFGSYPNSDAIKKQIMEPSKEEIERMLKAKNPINGVLRVDRRCINGRSRTNADGIRGCIEGCVAATKCLGITIPEEYLKRCRKILPSGEIIYSQSEGPGIANVDIIIVVAFTHCNDHTKASAASCFIEKQLDRPILGVIEMCIGKFQVNVNVIESVKIIQHEIIHALGFALNKYAYFRQSNGLPIVPRDESGVPALGKNNIERYYLWNDKIIKKVQRTRESVNGIYKKTMDAFVLENIVKVAQEHFGCPDIDAVDLEDAGGSGSALTHFDEYLLHNDIMTPQTNNALDVISKFTLALLQDTGWYEVDYSKAQDYDYGKGKGCTLPLKGCYRYMEEQRQKNAPLDPFCDRVFQYGNIARCSKKRNYYDYCHLTYYNEVSKENQYFREIPGIKKEDAQFYAGQSEFNEFCPFKVIFSAPNSFCNDITNSYLQDKYNILTSYYGKDSLCIENTLENSIDTVYYGASCQKYSYNATSKEYQIFIGPNSLTCPSNVASHFVIDNFYKISVKCPEFMMKSNSESQMLRNSKNFIIFTIEILLLFLILFLKID